MENEIAVNSDTAVKDKIKALLKALCAGLYEREEVMALALLSAIAGESMFILGPPGVGKSLIARRLKYGFKSGKSFEYLMTKFSTPDEVFGPISIKALKESDKYERITDNYLPDAHVVFLDEIWKSSSAIQNALLTVVNEKVYRNGQQEIPVELHALITASNELPPGDAGMGPLWDRLLVRYQLNGIEDTSRFFEMITNTEEVYEDPIPEALKIDIQELKTWQAEIDQIQIPEELLHSIQMVRVQLEKWNEAGTHQPLKIYDRRWKKIIRLMRTSAFLNGRSQVDLMDAFLMFHCLWGTPDHQLKLREIIAKTIRNHGYSIALPLSDFEKELSEFENEVEQETTVVRTSSRQVLEPFDDEYYQLIKPDQFFEGNFIKIQDFNKASTDQWQVTNFYDANYSLVNRLSAKKGDAQFSFAVNYNSQEKNYQLTTTKQETKEKISRKPHQALVKMWEERFQDLKKRFNQAQASLEEKSGAKWIEELQSNQFIDQRLAPLVKANQEEVLSKIKRFQLRLDKVKFAYEDGQLA